MLVCNELFRARQELRSGEIQRGLALFRSHERYVGRALLPAGTPMAALGLRLLSLQLRRWPSAHHCRQLHIHVFPHGPRDHDTHYKQWLASQRGDTMPSLQRFVPGEARRCRSDLQAQRGTVSRQLLPERRTSLQGLRPEPRFSRATVTGWTVLGCEQLHVYLSIPIIVFYY